MKSSRIDPNKSEANKSQNNRQLNPATTNGRRIKTVGANIQNAQI